MFNITSARNVVIYLTLATPGGSVFLLTNNTKKGSSLKSWGKEINQKILVYRCANGYTKKKVEKYI